ncbi:Eukaryotic protein of unknown function (DUF829) domain containing protein [Naviculisporaceae sp. PSN 640]
MSSPDPVSRSPSPSSSEAPTALGKSKQNHLPGFTSLSPQVLVQDADPSTLPATPKDPTTIILYSWGDALPKHVSKYVEGYRALFPAAKIVLIFSPILRALYTTLAQRAKTMIPVIEAVFGQGSTTTLVPRLSLARESSPAAKRVLVQVMSNTGGINFASTLHAYRQLVGPDAPPFPVDMMVCDSTPGSTVFMTNIGPWSKALALGAASYLPWPFVVTRALAVVFLAAVNSMAILMRETSAAVFSVAAVNDPHLLDIKARRLYLYSKEDDIIHWEDIEKHAADAREKGYQVAEGEMFEGTGHVGHLRAHPEQYWKAIQRVWEETVNGVKEKANEVAKVY